MSQTPEQAFLGQDDFNSVQYDQFLNQLFSLGTIGEKTYELFEGFNITLRPLSVVETLEISRKIDVEPGVFSKETVNKQETLARAICRINGNLLRFADTDIAEYTAFRGLSADYKPTEFEQQMHFIKYKFAPTLLNQIYSKYLELLKEQEDKFTELKKK